MNLLHPEQLFKALLSEAFYHRKAIVAVFVSRHSLQSTSKKLPAGVREYPGEYSDISPSEED